MILDDEKRKVFQQFLMNKNQPVSLSGGPRLSISGFNKYGQPENKIVNPTEVMLNEYSKSMPDIMSGLGMIEELFGSADKLIPTTDTPRQALGKRISRNVAASPVGELLNMQESDPTKLWKETSGGFGTLLARAFGEKGVVTNRDVSRILKMIPDVGETSWRRGEKKEFIKNMIKRRVGVYNKLVDLIGPEFGERVEINFE